MITIIGNSQITMDRIPRGCVCVCYSPNCQPQAGPFWESYMMGIADGIGNSWVNVVA